MRIWIINHYALPPSSAGGTRHYDFARELIQRGHEVVVFAANYNHLTHEVIAPHHQVGNVDTSFTVPFVWIPIKAYKGNSVARFLSMLMFSFRLLQKKYSINLNTPDIIIGSSPQLFAALSAERLARRYKIPFVLEVRDIWPDSLVELGRFSNKHILIRIMKKIELYLYKKAKKVISLLPSAMQYFKMQGVLEENVVWLPNTVALHHHETMDETPRHNNRFSVIYAGAHGLANDLDTVLDAGLILQEKGYQDRISLVLIGSGPEKVRLKQRVEKEKINTVHLLEPIAKNKMNSFLKQGDACLLLLKPSPVFRWGISPNKLFDYLAASKPIIFGVNTPFNPVEKAKCGLTIKPGDAASLAEAIISLSKTSTVDLKTMGEHGKAFVIENHDIIKLTDRLEQTLLTA